MPIKRNPYGWIAILCLLGYSWIGAHLWMGAHTGTIPTLCPIKQTTNIPCPSCGSTRAALAILSGNFHEAIHLNPFGYLLLFGLIIAPFWIGFDVLTDRSTLGISFVKVETIFKNKYLLIASTLLIALNWYWNIQKGL